MYTSFFYQIRNQILLIINTMTIITCMHACTVVQCNVKDDLPFLWELAFFDPMTDQHEI
jgi:hypothetical protein